MIEHSTIQPTAVRIGLELDDLRRTIFQLNVKAACIDERCAELHESLAAALADIRSMEAEVLQGDLFFLQ
jgi:hypothetical protein